MGSEMCIRDRSMLALPPARWRALKAGCKRILWPGQKAAPAKQIVVNENGALVLGRYPIRTQEAAVSARYKREPCAGEEELVAGVSAEAEAQNTAAIIGAALRCALHSRFSSGRAACTTPMSVRICLHITEH